MSSWPKWILLLFLCLSKAFAFESVRLTELSPGKKSFVLNVGVLDGAKVGDFVIINRKEGDFSLPKYNAVAKAEAIKVSDRSSFWMVLKVLDSKLLIEGEEFVMSRMPVGLGQSNVKEKFKVGKEKDSLAQLEHEYISRQVLPSAKDSTLGRKEIIRKREWSKVGPEELEILATEIEEKSLEEVQKETDREVFPPMLKGAQMQSISSNLGVGNSTLRQKMMRQPGGRGLFIITCKRSGKPLT